MKQRVDQIVKWIKYDEMKEATTLFELALWKAKIDLVDETPFERDACRVDVPGPVKFNEGFYPAVLVSTIIGSLDVPTVGVGIGRGSKAKLED